MFHRFAHRTRLLIPTVAAAAMLLAAAQAGIAQQTKPDTAPQTKPDANAPAPEKLFEGAIDHMGGRKAMEDLDSIHVLATIELPEQQRAQIGGNLEMELKRGKGDKLLFEQKMGNMGTVMTIGSNGDVTWTNNTFRGGYSIVEGVEEKEAIDQTMIVRHDMIDRMKEDGVKTETVGSESFNDTDAWKVRLEDQDGNIVHLFFAKDDGRILGIKSQQGQGPGGPPAMTMTFNEWKTFGPLKLYTKMTMSGNRPDMTLTFDSIEINTVDETVFELPDRIKEMADSDSDGDNASGSDHPQGDGHDHPSDHPN